MSVSPATAGSVASAANTGPFGRKSCPSDPKTATSSAGQRSRASRRGHGINNGIPLIAQAGRLKGQGC
jgi:hypothetical protein